MSGLGDSPLGEELGPWGGPGLITIKGVIPIGRSEVAIVCDRIPKLRDDGAWDDCKDPNNYLLIPIDPTQYTEDNVPFIPTGKVKATHDVSIIAAEVSTDDPAQIILTVDTQMEKFVEYELTVLFLLGAAGETFAGPTSWPFRALAPDKQQVARHELALAFDPLNDIANGFFSLNKDGTPGLTGWQVMSDSNLRHHGGLENATKRIHRRIFAGRGKYLIYGNGYGIDFRVGTLIRPGALRRLESAIIEQIRREPDVKDCLAAARISAPNMVTIDVRADIRARGVISVQQVIAF